MIVTLGEVKEYLKIDGADTIYDSFLTNWIGICQGLVEEYCGQKFEIVRIDDELVSGTGDKFLYVNNLPIYSVLSVQFTTDHLTWQNWEGTIWFDKYRIYSNKEFPQGTSNFKVSYQAGYLQAPGLIKRVIIEMVAQAWYEGPGLGTLGTVGLNISAGGSTGRSFKDILLERHLEILKPFKLERII